MGELTATWEARSRAAPIGNDVHSFRHTWPQHSAIEPTETFFPPWTPGEYRQHEHESQASGGIPGSTSGSYISVQNQLERPVAWHVTTYMGTSVSNESTCRAQSTYCRSRTGRHSARRERRTLGNGPPRSRRQLLSISLAGGRIMHGDEAGAVIVRSCVMPTRLRSE
ncbi:hypothetical protein K466DRAFT_1379 [Polyporus arcularius HHB13444]|uniref:Uncharacterized protein n=1 Tax=Polyporus arcularius HHB13444 TaxID=1314778 RepID=A0A5C3PZC6_9APHY|nr:hypothetical protein K466DRAFT_1379 [Polyporus arcularius HHB13444]